MPSVAAFALACASGQVRDARVLKIIDGGRFEAVYDASPGLPPQVLALAGVKVLGLHEGDKQDHWRSVEAYSYTSHRIGDVRGFVTLCLHGRHEADVLVDGADLANELVDLTLAQQTNPGL